MLREGSIVVNEMVYSQINYLIQINKAICNRKIVTFFFNFKRITLCLCRKNHFWLGSVSPRYGKTI